VGKSGTSVLYIGWMVSKG